MGLFQKDLPSEDIVRRQKFTRLFSWIALAVILSTLPLPVYFGAWIMYVPTMFVCVLLVVGLRLNARGYVSLVGGLMPLLVSTLLFCVALGQGRDAGGFLYFLPLIIATPFFIDHRNKQRLALHIAHPTFLLLVIVLGDFKPLIPDVSPEGQAVALRLNSMLVVFLCQFFVYEIIVTNTRSEQSLRESESRLRRQNEELTKINQELDRFVYSVSHDLRAPVASALGLTDLMGQETDLGELHEYNRVMEKNLRRLDRFIADILDYSRNARFEATSESINLEEEVRETVQQYSFMEEAAQVTVNICAEQSEDFHTDRYRLRVILNNLVSNALQYQNPTQMHKRLDISCRVVAGNALVKIRDNGIGIASQDLDRIFEMFYRASSMSSGSGLGLYIAKESAAKIGGTIRVVSEEEQFTEFTVEIPNQAVR